MGNIGPSDRAIRLWSGAILGPTALFTVAQLIVLPQSLAPVFGLSALYCFSTALLRWSPVYHVFGISTQPPAESPPNG